MKSGGLPVQLHMNGLASCGTGGGKGAGVFLLGGNTAQPHGFEQAAGEKGQLPRSVGSFGVKFQRAQNIGIRLAVDAVVTGQLQCCGEEQGLLCRLRQRKRRYFQQLRNILCHSSSSRRGYWIFPASFLGISATGCAAKAHAGKRSVPARSESASCAVQCGDSATNRSI